MNILALDLGDSLGWAYGSLGGVMASGLEDLRPRRGESVGMRYLRLRGFLSRVHGEVGFHLVGYEMPHYRGGYSTQALAGLAATVVCWCEEAKIEYATARSSDIKRMATGAGNASKGKVLEAARKKWPGQEIETDDVADALWCFECIRVEVA